MKGQKTVIVAVLAALLVALGAFINVKAADQKTLRIENKTRLDVWVEIYTNDAWTKDEGNKNANYHTHDATDYTDFTNGLRIVIVPAFGTVDIALDEDSTYYYQYRLCGKNLADIVDAQIVMKKDITLTLFPCDTQPTTMQVKNHLGVTIDLELIGYEEISVDIPPGLTVIEVYSGETIYKYDACDRDFNGVVDILPNSRTQFVLYSCEWYDSPAREYGGLNPVGFRLINHSSFPMILTLIGPENYLVTVEPGENRVQLVAGVYTYSYYMDYELISGSFFVSPNGNGIAMFSPSYTIDYGTAEEDLE